MGSNIFKYIYIDGINLDLKSKNKQSLLREMFKGMENHKDILNKEKLFEDLLKREEMGSTGIGKGVAIPHAKNDDVKSIIISIGVLKEPIDYQAIDDKKVNLIFMFFAPSNLTHDYLITLAKISRYIKEDEFRNRILDAQTKDEVYNIIKELEEK